MPARGCLESVEITGLQEDLTFEHSLPCEEPAVSMNIVTLQGLRQAPLQRLWPQFKLLQGHSPFHCLNPQRLTAFMLPGWPIPGLTFLVEIVLDL